MRYFLIYTVLMVMIAVFLGCETTNPLCSDTYCIEGEIYLKSELADDVTFDALPGTVSEETLVIDCNHILYRALSSDFEPVEITGKVDWDFLHADWQYRENRVTYLKKLTLEIETDSGGFYGENRVLLVHLNSDTVIRDVNFIKHVDFLGTETIN